MLVLLPSPRSNDERHTPSKALVGEFEREKVRDLEGSAVTSASKHIVAKKQVDQGPKVALGRLCRMAPQFGGDTLQILFRIAVKKRISAFVSVVSLLLFRIPAL